MDFIEIGLSTPDFFGRLLLPLALGFGIVHVHQTQFLGNRCVVKFANEVLNDDVVVPAPGDHAKTTEAALNGEDEIAAFIGERTDLGYSARQFSQVSLPKP